MKGKLILEDGSIFRGQIFGGSNATAVGEVVFNTGMTGYQEILTDPSYCRQIVTLTYPLIGNYGTAKIFNQSYKSFVGGLVIGELCDFGSNCAMEKSLSDYLAMQKIPCLYDVDTRAVTKKIRSAGIMMLFTRSRRVILIRLNLKMRMHHLLWQWILVLSSIYSIHFNRWAAK